ncbi:FecCD family ABC transporter permease [Bacillus sp. FJAT-44742]|uniref:FecCD family ABC transporter permease n=1 Tax=Bacillus sp. FJAT-44742 TaxID=2014005 RepID=UPI000C239E8B|nr:iron ABC transporter permease [Bacillus sp. FJAT-44742]
MSLTTNKKKWAAYGGSVLFLFAALIIGISIGSIGIPFSTTVIVLLQEGAGIPLGAEIDSVTRNIILDIRLPRVTLALLVGASLAMAGSAFQGFLKNPLADPFTLGVSSGAALGAVIVLFLGLSLPLIGAFTLPFVSVVSGFLTLFLVLFFARIVQKNLATETIILAGIIFSSFLGSLMSLLIALTGEELRQIITWLMGSVSMRGWSHVFLMLPFFIAGAVILFANSRELNAMVFGEETAKTLGVNTEARKISILLGASLLTGSAVAVSGTIGFVGLVIPHLVRLLFGADHRHHLPLSLLIGGAFLVLTDMAARTLIAPTELPIGVLTAIIGAPVFGLLLLRERKKL